MTPSEFVGPIIGLCVERRGVQLSSVNIDNDRLLMHYILPLSEIILDFNDRLKSISSGYASFNYEDHGYHLTNVVRLDIHLNGRPIEELCRIVHASKAQKVGREMVNKLKEEIPRQMVQIAVQACVGSKVLARETIKAYRKDVTAKLVSLFGATMQFVSASRLFVFSLVWGRCNATHETAQTTSGGQKENANVCKYSRASRNLH